MADGQSAMERIKERKKTRHVREEIKNKDANVLVN